MPEEHPPIIQPSAPAAIPPHTESNPDSVETVFRPNELLLPLRNPDKGWIAYDFTPISHPGKAMMSPAVSTVYSNYFSWGDLEPYEGQYRWDIVDRWIAAYPDRKLKIAVVLLDPHARDWCGETGFGQTPLWLSHRLSALSAGRWTSSVSGVSVPRTCSSMAEYASDPTKCRLNSKCGSGPAMVFEPLYSNEQFLQAHGRFVWAFARRYFSNTKDLTGYEGAPDWSRSLSGVDLATYGAWGEWHSDMEWSSAEVKRSALNTMILHYYQAFSTLASQSGKDAPELEQSAVGSTISKTSNDIYLHDDPSQVRFSIEQAPKTYDAVRSAMVRKFLGADPHMFFQDDERVVVATNIERVPFRLEWGSYSGALTTDQFGKLGGTPMTVDAAVEYALTLGANAIGWYKNVAEDHFPLSAIKQGQSLTIEDYFQIYSGYHFYVSEFRFPKRVAPGQTFTIAQTWQQRGRGKLYRRHFFAAWLEGSAGTFSLGLDAAGMTAHTWPVGPAQNKAQSATFTVPLPVPPGNYELLFAVVDRTGAPAMNLANDGKEFSDIHRYGRYRLGTVVVQ